MKQMKSCTAVGGIGTSVKCQAAAERTWSAEHPAEEKQVGEPRVLQAPWVGPTAGQTRRGRRIHPFFNKLTYSVGCDTNAEASTEFSEAGTVQGRRLPDLEP